MSGSGVGKILFRERTLCADKAIVYHHQVGEGTQNLNVSNKRDKTKAVVL